MSDHANEHYDEWLDAIEAGEGYYLACPEGHGSLPPRRVCPDCGARELTEAPLPDTATVETFTVTHVSSPQFEADAPYATAIARFGDDGVAITGQVRGVDLNEVETGMGVSLSVEETETTGERIVVFRPA